MAQTKLMWSNLGPIRADMALDHVPKQAGVYQLTFKLWGNTYTYIGEAGARGLRARIGDHAVVAIAESFHECRSDAL